VERVEVAKTVESKRTVQRMLAFCLEVVDGALGYLCSEMLGAIAVAIG